MQPSDATLPVSRKAQKEQAREVQKAEKAPKDGSPPSKSFLKRKRSDVDESDPKLKEFLEVMRPNSTLKAWTTQGSHEEEVEEPPKKVQVELPDAESDSEYEMVPRRSKKRSTPVPAAPSLSARPIEEAGPLESEHIETQSTKPEPVGRLDTTDDQWLRSRTSRLLDLVDPTNVVGQNTAIDGFQPSTQGQEYAVSAEVDLTAEQGNSNENTLEDVPRDEVDPTSEAILSSGRLFVRNLAYSATEDELRKYFESFGILEEVNKLCQ